MISLIHSLAGKVEIISYFDWYLLNMMNEMSSDYRIAILILIYELKCFFLFVCLFFSKISFLHSAVFILDWKLAFFGLNIFFFRNFVYFTYKHTGEHTHTHTHTHTQARIHITLWEPNCVVTVIAMFVVSLLGATIKKICIMQ